MTGPRGGRTPAARRPHQRIGSGNAVRSADIATTAPSTTTSARAGAQASRGSSLARRSRALEAKLRQANTLVVLLDAKGFGSGGEILVRDAEHGAAVGLLLRNFGNGRALGNCRTEHETTRHAADRDADHSCLLRD